MSTIALSRNNVLLPQGYSQVIVASGYSGALSWSISQNAAIAIGSASGSNITVSVASNATVGSQATLSVSDTSGNSGQTKVMVGPASGYTSRCLLTYGKDATGQFRAGLLNADDGTFTWLPSIPGVLTSQVLSNANPTTQVVRQQGDVGINCYVLNMESLSNWAVG